MLPLGPEGPSAPVTPCRGGGEGGERGNNQHSLAKGGMDAVLVVTLLFFF